MSVANRVTKFLYGNEAHRHSGTIEDTCLKILSLCHSQPLEQALCVHTPILKLGLHKNLYLTNNVLTLYSKTHGPETARHFFDEMPHRDIVSWTSLVSAYTRDDRHREALELFDSMAVSGETPNEFTFSSVLRSCSSLGEFSVGTRVHAFVVKLGFGSNSFLLSSLIDLYSKCGFSDKAREVFAESVGGGDTVTWTAAISSTVLAGEFRSALRRYIEMTRARVSPNGFTFAKLLEAASRVSDPGCGRSLHAHLTVLGIRPSPVLKTGLVEMYSGLRRMDEAAKVMRWSTEHDVVLWTSLISGFVDNLRVKEAVSSLTEMRTLGVSPNSFTYSSVLKSCWTVSSLELGRQIHSLAIMAGLESDVCFGNSLVEMYMTCSNFVDEGLRAFEEIISPNVVSWTCLISGFSEHGLKRDSFELFSRMRAQGVEPNSFTISTVLSICSTVKSYTQTAKLHGYIIKSREDSDIAVGNALVDSYAAMGMVNKAWRVLKTMSQRDAVTYTSIATRMNKLGRPETALGFISRMSEDGVEMDGFSLASFLSASAELAALETGKNLHCRAVKSGLRSSASVSNALVDFYWKCGGRSSDGRRAFKEISKLDVVSWNGFISGLASNGYFSEALSAFDDMRLAGFKPDSVTFLLLLSACSRGGLVDLGIEYFHSMRRDHFISPQIDHYVCLIDLLGRSGQLENAVDVIESIPFEPNPLIYKTLLSSCRLHKNIPLGEDLVRRGVELDPSDPTFYSMLANLYDESGRADLAKKTRQLMRDKGLRRNIGRSWMEIRNEVHVFESGDMSHPRIKEICDKIESLVTKLKKRGYACSVMEGSVGHHSEKLAVAFGLLVRPSNAAIRISKNMRICKQCHEFIMLVTRLVDNDIIVRDGNQIHNFKCGECSCQGC